MKSKELANIPQVFPWSRMSPESHVYATSKLDTILKDFGLERKENGSSIKFVGEIPDATATSSQKIDLSLIGTIPSLANAIAATQIYEARGGARQTIEVDLRRGHNYIDPDIGMTPSINGQVCRAIVCVSFIPCPLRWLGIGTQVVDENRVLGNHSRPYCGESIFTQYF
jgi:hypothetical protein